jgi:signal transduction histidine kinase
VSARAPSLLFKIVVRLSLVSLTMLVISYGWLYLKVDATARALREKTLIEQGQQIAHYLSIAPDGAIRLEMPAKLSEAYNQEDGEYHYAVRAEDGQVLFSSGGEVGPIPIFKRHRHRTYRYDPDGPGPLEFFGAAVRVPVGAKTLVVQVEQDGSHTDLLIDEVTDEFLTDGGWLAGPLLLTMLVVSILTIRGSLLPLRSLSRKAAQITPGRTELRLPEAAIPREILPLVRAVNSALDRVDSGFRMQQEFTADAAHELRTPLAVLGAHIDTLADQTTAQALRKDLDAMARIVSQLLAVARLEALALPEDERAELNGLARQAASDMSRLAVLDGKSIALEIADGPVLVHGNPPALGVALQNLIENGLAHTPSGTTVRIKVTPEPAIEVNDAGPGVPAELRDKVFLRFWRTDRSRSGAGLGLAIVQRTMEAHGGRISIDDALEGGARFTLHFPPPILSGAGPVAAPTSSGGRRRWYRRPSIAPLVSHESGGGAS